MIISKIKTVLVFFINLVKRSLCCFRRRRKSSTDVVPLSDVGVVPNISAGPELGSWNTWEDGSMHKPPQTVGEHIEYYRNTKAGNIKQEVEEQTPDFFQDMEPTIKRQMKIMIRPKEQQTMISRVSFVPDILPNDSGELRSWEETENREGDWAESSDSWTVKEALKQNRREEKIRRQMERDQRRFAVS